MLQSKLFYKTLKENPRDTEAISHALLTRAGFIDQTTAGVYSFLPLGIATIKKIEKIVRDEMTASPINGQEILMSALTPKENWERTGRWHDFDALFKLRGTNEKDYALAATHEEVVVPLAKKIILSYKDIPLYLFQIQTKFRNELRVKSGLLRTREFLMKDLYSFHASGEDLDSYYEKMIKTYFNVYKRCGILTKGKEKITFLTLASGGSFSKNSHEFQMLTNSGEDIIYICKKCGLAINKEIKDTMQICPTEKCKSKDFEIKKAVEVGNIFKLGTRYSMPFDLKFRDKDGIEKLVVMGCYGIGISRLMASVVEANHDNRGIIWPSEVAPFKVHLIRLESNPKVVKKADKIYEDLKEQNIDVLYDDRKEKMAGEKFAEADLIGLPWRILVSEKTLKSNSIEFKKRGEEKSELVKISELEKFLSKKLND